MEPGDLFASRPATTRWVVGDEPYVSLHFLGAGEYATSLSAPSRPARARRPSPAAHRRRFFPGHVIDYLSQLRTEGGRRHKRHPPAGSFVRFLS